MTRRERLLRLARVLCVKPISPERLRLVRCHLISNWYLTGTVGGDTALPFTRDANTEPEALDMIEAWLAPEIDRLEDD